MMYAIWAAIVVSLSLFAWGASRKGWLPVIVFIVSAPLVLQGLNIVRGIPHRCDLSYQREVIGYLFQQERIVLLLADPEYCWIAYTDAVAEGLQKEVPKGSKKYIGNVGADVEGKGIGGQELFGYEENPVVTQKFPQVPYTK